ncbi:N-acetylmuramoyl-L-alanine amidase family protein [Paenibacillus oleatilyticus]|uniref:N-acetylmuramoyl-L-alanine amidase n=1 Tax=Paenibacillus oleatilyticus TaxID=2594886 RepID=A0ABV4VA16_9BACL
MIDPGHGGKDHGATGASGSFEKDFTLKLAHKVEEMAKQEPRIQVYMTRTDDRFISSVDRERPKFANDLGADLFISIYGNTYEDPGVSGMETYYYLRIRDPWPISCNDKSFRQAGFGTGERRNKIILS